MRVVLQRVSRASVTVEGVVVGRIGRGVLLLLGVHDEDDTEQADFLASKCVDLRIFPGENGKMNHSLQEVGGEILVVSQFTLYGDCRKGRRPSYTRAADPEKGERLYEYFVNKLTEIVPTVETGVFGAHMNVEIVNDGPVTLILER
ncbi:MAG: D-tyrosyl-tRNA(Tyr) deacylase [Chitinivibrionales bacterium]|nr:D-tyrosyl-tRNA(Tyr) deacylase [Chitinivibrionales bacterium]MBD3358898.1 D-tyrosyl-tRNA(Tyr) deacylase [Chitinivibrionales bacterium]